MCLPVSWCLWAIMTMHVERHLFNLMLTLHGERLWGQEVPWGQAAQHSTLSQSTHQQGELGQVDINFSNSYCSLLFRSATGMAVSFKYLSWPWESTILSKHSYNVVTIYCSEKSIALLLTVLRVLSPRQLQYNGTNLGTATQNEDSMILLTPTTSIQWSSSS